MTEEERDDYNVDSEAIEMERRRSMYGVWPENFPSQKEQEEHDRGDLLDEPLSPPYLLPFILDDLEGE
jgi:hypothetical protein